MEVKDYMSTNVITVTPETTVMKALDLMKEHDIHRLPVVEDGKLVGLLTEELVAGHSPSMATSLSMRLSTFLDTTLQVLVYSSKSMRINQVRWKKFQMCCAKTM